MIRSAEMAKTRRVGMLRSGTALTHPVNIAFVLTQACMVAGAVGVLAGPAAAQEIQSGGGAGADDGGVGGAGGLAGGGGGGGEDGFELTNIGGDGGGGALLGADAEAGDDGGDEGAYSGGAGGQPGSLNDLSAGGGGGGGGATDIGDFGYDGEDGGDGGLGTVFGGNEVTLLGAATGTDGTDAYGGGGGGGGAIVLTGIGSVTTNDQTVTGGGGGEGGGGGGGGAGIVTVNGGNVFVTGGTVTGGAGGFGYYGGTGGAGVFLYGGGMLDNASTGSIIGGAGGSMSRYGGQGGAGILVNHGEVDNAGVIKGGAGGNAVDGGLGGSGLATHGGTIMNQAGATIDGGAGGSSTDLGDNAYSAGDGGAGVVFVDAANDGRLENFGAIAGGAGSAIADNTNIPGVGGVGVLVADDNVAIVNAGTIAGGLSGHADPSDQMQANSVELDGANNTLELRDGYAFTGNVVARGEGNTLMLGGDTSPADPFDISKIADTETSSATDEFIGFDQFEKTGTSTWALTGDGSGFTGAAIVSEGRLDIAGQLGLGEGIVDYTGGNPDGTATVTVAGAGSAWDLSGNLTVGQSGTGILSIADGGVGTNFSGAIGYSEGGTGRVTVTGPGSVWTLDGGLQIGREGTGELIIADGGAVATNHPWTDTIASRVNSIGEMIVTGAGSTWNGTSLDVGHLGTGTLTVDDGGVVSVTENILLASHAGSIGTLNIGAAAGDDAVAAGIVGASAITFGDGDGALVFNHTGNPDGSDHVFASAIGSGAGTATIEQIAGATTLTGDSSGFDGSTNVFGGMITVDGALGGRLDVGTGGTLGGNGTVGTTTVADGGTIAPGNSIGTLTVDGNLTLSSGAILDYEIGSPGTTANLGTSDRIDVTGDLALNGTLNLSQSGDAGDGTAGLGYYRLMTYGGDLSGDGLTVGSHPEIEDAGAYAIQTSDGNVDLFIAALGDDTLQHWQGGEGAWNTGNAQWLNRDGDIPVTWAGHHAVFKNQPGGFDGGTITVEGTQGFEGLQFVDEGYRLTGDGALETAADGSEIRVLADSAEIATTITGTGDIAKTEAGTLVLSGQNSYQGGTTINGGAVQVSADANLGDAEGGLTLNGGQLVTTESFDSSRAVNLAGDGGFDVTGETSLGLTGHIAGTGDLFKQGDGTLTLSGDNGYGNTHVTAGTLIGDASAISGDISNAGMVIFEQLEDAGYAGALSGTGDVVKDGDGTLFYGGDGSGFGGMTTVAGGMLSVNGAIGGSLDVGTGATLGGSGTVASTTVAAGGTIAPGNSIGTLTVAGDLTLETGARYIVEVMPDSSDSDLLQVTGHAGLEGGSVAHIGATGNYDLRSSYTILSAQELEGSFDDVTSGFAFLNPDLLYDYDLGTVTLELARNDRAFISAAQTDNQKAAAGGIDSIGFDTGHVVHDAIAQLGDDDALVRAGFDALSGEIHASARSALIEDGRFPREAANDRLRAVFGGKGTSAMPVIGFAEGRPGPVAADSSRLAAWGQAFGAWGEFDSDGNAASLDRSSGGFLMGADAPIGENWRLGALAGIGHGSFDADDRHSSGSDDNYHFGLYGGTQWNDWSFRSGLAYTRHDIETSRTVAISGYGRDKLEADYDATSLQAFGELGYRIETATASYEPFVGLAHLRLKTDGFTERGGEAALHVAEQQTETSFATLGVRGSTDIRFEGTRGTLRGMLGWRHAFGDTTPLSRHAFSAGDAFTIAGVPIAEDAAVIEAGIDLDLSDTSQLGVSYQGQFGSGVQESGLKADLQMKF